MATYKVIQDIEAEDHILGPLTLRQFIYSLVAVFFFYLSFITIAKHVPVLLVFLLPPGLFSAFLAFPFGRDQPTEVWAISKLRFLIKPKKRLWNQSGVKEMVTITAPKKIETHFTNGLSQNEVVDRLQALAATIDSRGWAVKNMASMPMNSNYPNNGSERLITPGSIPRPVPDYQLNPEEDILDEQNNPRAMQMSSMIDRSSVNHRQQLIDSLNQSPQPQGQNWFDAENEAAISSSLKAINSNSGLATSNLHVLSSSPTVSKAKPVQTNKVQPIKPATSVDPAILNLANNNDLNVATIAHEASKSKLNDEVVINLR